MLRITPPRRAVIHQHPPRQPITAKISTAVAPCLLARFRRPQAQRKARMIVHHRQRMATHPLPNAKCPLKSICHSSLGAPARSVEKADVYSRPARPPADGAQNRVDRAHRRHLALPQRLQPGPQLASAPSRMLIPNRQHLGFDHRRRTLRRLPRAPRPILQSRLFRLRDTASAICRPVLRLIPNRPHSCFTFACDWIANSTNSLRSNISDHSFHGMLFLLRRSLAIVSSVTHVSEQCYLCPRSIQSGVDVPHSCTGVV